MHQVTDSKSIETINNLAKTKEIDLKRNMSSVIKKPVLGVSDQVGHKSGCTAAEDG